MTHTRRFACACAILMLAAFAVGSCPISSTMAAASAKAISFTSDNTGIEVGYSDSVKFTAKLDTTGVQGLYVQDESGKDVVRLTETAPYTYEGEVHISANEKSTQTYSLNTANSDELTCDINFYNPLTASDIARDDKTWDMVKSVSNSITEANKTAVLSGVYSTLRADENVTEVWYETDSIINFKTADGVGNVYDADLALQRKDVTVQQETENDEEILSDMRATESYIGNRNICIIAPDYGVEGEEDFTTNYLTEAISLKNAMGGGSISAFYGNGHLDYNIGSEPVTVGKGDIAAFKNLDRYGMILVDAHGSLYGSQNLICVTYTSGASNADYSAGRLVRGDIYTGVLAPFITYYTHSLPNSIVYLGSCYGMHTSHLSNAFLGLGAGFITGYTQSVSFVYEKRIFGEYTKQLRTVNPDTGKFNSTKEAFDKAIDRFGRYDEYGSEHARWDCKGDYNLYIGDRHTPIPVTAITLLPETAEINVGDTLQLTVTTEPEGALKYSTVSWSSFNEDVAQVNSNGLVSGVDDGKTVIACELKDELGNAFNASMKITVVSSGFTVKFVDGLTEEVISTQQVEAGKAAKAPEVPTHDGYTFTGWDKDFSNVTSNMTVTAMYGLTGDATGDGNVNTGDASFVLKYVAGLLDLSDEASALADFNNDGKVNTADASAILRFAAN